MINKLERVLAYYHGILQIPHLLMNFVILIIIFKIVPFSGKLGVEALYLEGSQLLILSSIIDFFVTSPLGIFFLITYIRGHKSAPYIGLVSLVTTFISTLIYLYAHIAYSLWPYNPGNILIIPLFTPPIILFFIVCYKLYKKEKFLRL